jgi:hypothetical protein
MHSHGALVSTLTVKESYSLVINASQQDCARNVWHCGVLCVSGFSELSGNRIVKQARSLRFCCLRGPEYDLEAASTLNQKEALPAQFFDQLSCIIARASV